MTWKEALDQSEKGTANRKEKNGDYNETYIKYKDGGIYKLVAKDNKVQFHLSNPVHGPRYDELNEMTDWLPS